MQSQDGDAKQTEKADEPERAPTADQQEADKSGAPAEGQEKSVKEDAPAPTGHPANVTAPVVETSVDEREGEPEKDPEEAANVEAGDQEQDESRMHVLGHDDNIRTKSLEALPPDQVG